MKSINIFVSINDVFANRNFRGLRIQDALKNAVTNTLGQSVGTQNLMWKRNLKNETYNSLLNRIIS